MKPAFFLIRLCALPCPPWPAFGQCVLASGCTRLVSEDFGWGGVVLNGRPCLPPEQPMEHSLRLGGLEMRTERGEN